MSLYLSPLGHIPNVDLGEDTGLFRDLMNIWRKRQAVNYRRSVYYDGEQALKDFGISLPPQMRGIRAALGWSTKGVHALTDRSLFQGFVSSTGEADPFGVSQIMAENRFAVEFPAAQVSSAVHGCSFLAVSRGDVQAGEPAVQIIGCPAERSAGIWSERKRALTGFVSVVDTDKDGRATDIVVYSPSALWLITRDGEKWSVDRRHNPYGRVTVAPVVHGYDLRRPLGHSRITRASMYAVDAAMRTIVRSEVSAEFYSAPEYWLFGADVSQFQGGDRWSAVMGRIKALEFDPDNGDPEPKLHRFTGASPQPHTDQLRMWANLFADDQDLDVKFADSSNPSSADAIFAAKETLITATVRANKLWAEGAQQAMGFAVMIRDGLDTLPNEFYRVSADFMNPSIVSPSGRADAYSKIAASDPQFATSRVGRQYAGLSGQQIDQLEAETRRAGVRSLVARAAQDEVVVEQAQEVAAARVAGE